MKIEYQDRIDDYLLGRMPEEERKRFEVDMEDNSELKEQLKFTETVQQAIRSRNEKLAKIKEWQEKHEHEERLSPSRSNLRQLLYWSSGIAAMFIAGFFLFQNLYIVNSPNPMPMPNINGATFRASSDNFDILELIDQRNYKEAMDLIEEKNLNAKSDSLEIVQDSDMEEEQKAYDMQLVKDKMDELKWLKAYTLLGMGQQTEALLLLDELRDKKGNYQMAADSLYNQIK